MSDRVQHPRDEAIGKIAASISAAKGARSGGSFLSPGDVASLRRMDIGIPPGPFWRLMSAYVPEHFRSGEEAERRWALVLKGMAVMAPNTHDGSRRPGAMLNQVGFASEDRPIRINRLLRAEGESFEDLFLRACSFLASKAQPIDWRVMARFALFQGDSERKTLARDFYSGASSQSSTA